MLMITLVEVNVQKLLVESYFFQGVGLGGRWLSGCGFFKIVFLLLLFNF